MSDKSNLLREALERARGVIASLPVDCLGFGETTRHGSAPDEPDETQSWPIQFELLSYIDAALSAPSPAGTDYVVGVRKATDEMLSAAVAEVKRQDADETYDPANGRMWFEGYFNLREIIDAALAAAPARPAPTDRELRKVFTEMLAQILERRGYHKDAADFRDSDKAPVALEAMLAAYELGMGSLKVSEVPGHTDLMVSPESIDKFMEENPLPEEPAPIAAGGG